VGVVVFDVLGTLFDLSALDPRFEKLGGRSGTRDAWYERLLDTSKALTLAGDFEPFQDLALSTLRTTLASHGLDSAGADEIVDALDRLPAYPEAAAALDRIAEAGLQTVVLTNGGGSQTKALLERAGLDAHVAVVFASEEVEAYKPHPRLYEYVCESLAIEPGQATLVSAHAWDVAGARSAGYEAIWIDRTERSWPLPSGEPERWARDLEAAAALVVGLPLSVT
jgi:2-haloacid dehalogenase